VRLRRSERICAAAASLLALGSAAWFGLRWVRDGAQAKPAPVALAGDYAAAAAAKPTPPTVVNWPAPQAQARGPGWVYDVFTPPEIFYDADTQRFRVAPRESPATVAPAQTGFGLEVLSVAPDLFPLQLLGYVGRPGEILGTFENTATSETLLLRTGDRVPDLGLTIESVTVERETVKLPESMAVQERQVNAVVRDDRTGRRTALNQSRTACTETAHAQVIVDAAAASPRLVHAGDVIDDGATHYKIEKIRLAPPGVDVTKEVSGHDGIERQTLVPREADAPTPP
jgi:hypothetical protein